MTDVDFKIGEGMTFPVLTAVLSYNDAIIPLNLAGPTVEFFMRREGYPELKIDSAPALISNPTTSEVEYGWDATDTDEPGVYLGYFVVTYTNGNSVMVPDDGFIRIAVVPA